MNEKVQKTPEQIEQAAFSLGFGSETETTAAPPEVKDDKAAPVIEKPPEVKAKPKPTVKPKDEFVRLTKPEYESLKTNAGRVPELEKRIETAFGKFGPLQQMVNELKAGTPKGQAVELPADVVSELEAEFPELAGGVKAALTKALKGLIGTGKSETAPDDKFSSRIEEWAMNRARTDLDEEHPKWREIVGVVDTTKGEQPNAAHPFRAWLAKQPQAFQDKINNTVKPSVIADAITRYQVSQRPAPKKVVAKPVQTKKALLRQKRFQSSVQPRGLGAPAAPQAKAVVDHFRDGFKSG